jgi:hypothetical protein
VLFSINLPTENYNQLVGKNRLPKMPGENGSENVGQRHGAKTRGRDKGQTVDHLVPTGIAEPQHDRGEIFGVNYLEKYILHRLPISLTGYALRIKQEFLLGTVTCCINKINRDIASYGCYT